MRALTNRDYGSRRPNRRCDRPAALTVWRLRCAGQHFRKMTRAVGGRRSRRGQVRLLGRRAHCDRRGRTRTSAARSDSPVGTFGMAWWAPVGRCHRAGGCAHGCRTDPAWCGVSGRDRFSRNRRLQHFRSI